jgi:hypothetical protein
VNGKLLPILICCLFGCALWSSKVFAEGNCPPGYFPIGGGSAGWQGCAPMGPSPGNNPGQTTQPAPKPRWGAIATTSGAFGVAVGADSKSRAERLALVDCESMSKGKPCEVQMAFENQCAALAWGTRNNAVASAPFQQRAEELALSTCSNEGVNCEIYYSGCSLPTRN